MEKKAYQRMEREVVQNHLRPSISMIRGKMCVEGYWVGPSDDPESEERSHSYHVERKEAHATTQLEKKSPNPKKTKKADINPDKEAAEKKDIPLEKPKVSSGRKTRPQDIEKSLDLKEQEMENKVKEKREFKQLTL